MIDHQTKNVVDETPFGSVVNNVYPKYLFAKSEFVFYFNGISRGNMLSRFAIAQAV